MSGRSLLDSLRLYLRLVAGNRQFDCSFRQRPSFPANLFGGHDCRFIPCPPLAKSAPTLKNNNWDSYLNN